MSLCRRVLAAFEDVSAVGGLTVPLHAESCSGSCIVLLSVTCMQHNSVDALRVLAEQLLILLAQCDTNSSEDSPPQSVFPCEYWDSGPVLMHHLLSDQVCRCIDASAMVHAF